MIWNENGLGRSDDKGLIVVLNGGAIGAAGGALIGAAAGSAGTGATFYVALPKNCQRHFGGNSVLTWPQLCLKS